MYLLNMQKATFGDKLEKDDVIAIDGKKEIMRLLSTLQKPSSPVMNLIKNPVKSMEYRNLTARQKSDMEELKTGILSVYRS